MIGHADTTANGDVTIGVPTAQNHSDAPLPGLREPQEWAVHEFDGRPVVYRRVHEHRPPVEMVFTFEGQPVLYKLYEGGE